MSDAFRLRHHPRARRLTLRVNRDASLDVVAPPGTPAGMVRRFVAERAEWIAAARRRLAAERLPESVRGPRPAELRLAALDRTFAVRYRSGRPERAFWRSDELCLRLVDPAPEAVRGMLVGALKQLAASALEPRLAALADRHGLRYGRVTWRNQKSRWGSCSARGNLSLNVRLMFVEPPLVDYVFAHELAHLDHPDHSPRFWRRVEQLLPGAQEHRYALKEAGRRVPDWIL